MDLIAVYDFTEANVGSVDVPPGTLAAGYVTGTDGVPWTDAQFSRFPGAIRIDQAPVNTPANELADVIDMETGAATLDDLPAWVHAAWANFTAGTRPGQRAPTVYCSAASVTPVVNALTAAGIGYGVNLWVAKEMTAAQAAAMVTAANGPFPIVGVQYQFNDNYDVSEFSANWINRVSQPPRTTPSGPGTQQHWRFCAKCQGLFYGPGVAVSACPKGGQHDGGHSHDYVLGFTQ